MLDGAKILTLTSYSTTSVLQSKADMLAFEFRTSALVIEKIVTVARTDQREKKPCHRKLVRL
jgi:hypothetical protein